MKSTIIYGFAALLGVSASAPAIEPPDTAAPIPPQASPEEAALPEVEIPHAGAVAEPPAVEIPAAAARAYLGVGGSQVPELLGEHLGLEPGQGVVVRSLVPDGPAAKAGLQHNDVITRVSGKPVGSHEALREAITGLRSGEAIDIDYIHRGDAKAARVTLGDAPAQPREIAGVDPEPLEQLMLDGMPPDQAKRIHEAIQQNLKAFEGLQGGEGALPHQLFGKDMQKRMQQMLQGMAMPEALEMPDLKQEGGIHMKSSGTLRMLNPDGSGVEVKSRDGGKEVRVLGADGKVEWEGPYDTPQDKEAAPPEVRQRIEGLNLDMDFKGNGLRFHMRPGLPSDGE